MNQHKYGVGSRRKIMLLHPLLPEVLDRGLALSPYDVTIIHTLRGKRLQNVLYANDDSTKLWPYSTHNQTADPDIEDPFLFSDAFDFAPWVNGAIPWKDTHIFALIAGVYIAAAKEYSITLRWGGDWDSDGHTTDQTLLDWGHLEIIHG
jgi:peptidoglycan L-alanyl-D-glutamate endopeptidase CwlK